MCASPWCDCFCAILILFCISKTINPWKDAKDAKDESCGMMWKLHMGLCFFLACSTLSKAGKFETCHSFLFFYLRREARNIPRRHPETYLRNKPLRQTCWFSNIKKRHIHMNILPTWMACPIFSLNASPSSVHAQKLARRLFAVKLLPGMGCGASALHTSHES